MSRFIYQAVDILAETSLILPYNNEYLRMGPEDKASTLCGAILPHWQPFYFSLYDYAQLLGRLHVEEVGYDHMLPFRNLINTTCICQFSCFCAEYGGLNFMLSPKGMDLANICLVQVLEMVYLCAQWIQ